jgi:hypothetical protein
MGFVLSPVDAHQLIENDLRNSDVIFPYLNGDDLNSRPDQSPSRWVINFFDWPIEKAMEYPACFKIVQEKVKPERTRKKDDGEFALRKPLPQKWWIYADKRPELYRTISGMKRVLVGVRHTKYHSVSFVPVGFVYSDATYVIADNSDSWFGLFQSSIHEAWARQYSGSLETRMRYSPSDCFDSFPIPALITNLDDIGLRYSEQRVRVMRKHNSGLTDIYNLFHDPDGGNADINELKRLHADLDNAVAAAYDWTDLDLGHGFHETKLGVRYTISEPARREVLARLLKLNHERYAEEVKQGLHEKKKPKATKGKKQPKSKSHAGPSLFQNEEDDDE